MRLTIWMISTRTITLFFNLRHIQFVPHLFFLFLCIDQLYNSTSIHPTIQPTNILTKKHPVLYILQQSIRKIFPATIPTPLSFQQHVEHRGNVQNQHVVQVDPNETVETALKRIPLSEIQYKTVVKYRKKQAVILCILYTILTFLVLSLAITLEYLSIIIKQILENKNVIYQTSVYQE